MMKHQITPAWNGLDDRLNRWVRVFGRLRPGPDARAAQLALEPAFRAQLQLDLADPGIARAATAARERHAQNRLVLLPGEQGRSRFRIEMGTPLRVLMGIAAGVLLIACANVANLLLVRGRAARGRSRCGWRSGATRGRLVRQLLVENLVLSLAGRPGRPGARRFRGAAGAGPVRGPRDAVPYPPRPTCASSPSRRRPGDADRRALRPGARAARREARRGPHAEGAGRRRARRWIAAAPQGAGCRAGRDLAADVDRRRPVRAHARATCSPPTSGTARRVRSSRSRSGLHSTGTRRRNRSSSRGGCSSGSTGCPA